MSLNWNAPAKPWRILTIRDLGPGYRYRYVVTGENHYHSPAERIFWRIHDLDDPRYDLSAAKHETDTPRERLEER